jgi:hypothetical protein
MEDGFMFSFLVATSVAISSVSVDGIFGKKSSCSSGSCSSPVAVAAKPAVVEKKVEAKDCTSSCSQKTKKHHKLFASRKGCRG